MVVSKANLVVSKFMEGARTFNGEPFTKLLPVAAATLGLAVADIRRCREAVRRIGSHTSLHAISTPMGGQNGRRHH